ncbi:hypothetical protein FBUS_09451 [Fasciolopsis buskii]|uniref:PRELI/MSF1 domain-containing protein n=1 Tax=Fasciolopsis buskii TaxID=27845 RepID=A0A8E0S882_9TREM|nr:hypothetical protein FBUS_09451 [Fasciolopsis buski]
MLTSRKGWEEESIISNVLNIDVVNRSVDPTSGVMHSLRLFNSCWSNFTHMDQIKGLEWSAIDSRQKKMVAVTHNVDLRGVLKAVEHMEYSVHPENDDWYVNLLFNETLNRSSSIIFLECA